MATDPSNLPPHVQQQAAQAAKDSGVSVQAAATQQNFTDGQGIDNAQRSVQERAREAQQEQQAFNQQQAKDNTPNR